MSYSYVRRDRLPSCQLITAALFIRLKSVLHTMLHCDARCVLFSHAFLDVHVEGKHELVFSASQWHYCHLSAHYMRVCPFTRKCPKWTPFPVQYRTTLARDEISDDV